MRVTRILYVCVTAPCCQAAGEGARDPTEYARRRLASLGSASTKCFLFLIIPKRRECAKSVRETQVATLVREYKPEARTSKSHSDAKLHPSYGIIPRIATRHLHRHGIQQHGLATINKLARHKLQRNPYNIMTTVNAPLELL